LVTFLESIYLENSRVCNLLRKRAETKSEFLPRQPLDKTGAELVEGNRDTHVPVKCV
jgi:hypothetical protein